MTPVHPIVEALLGRLDESDREVFEERAGIMQFEVGHPRDLAEGLAMLEVIRANPLAVSGLRHLHVHYEDRQVSVLATDLAFARQQPEKVVVTAPETGDLLETVRQLGGVAALLPFK
jgi:hypothetical protein